MTIEPMPPPTASPPAPRRSSTLMLWRPPIQRMVLTLPVSFALPLHYHAAIERTMEISIERLGPADQDFLWQALYLSLHVPVGEAEFDPQIVHRPELARY